MHFDNIPSVSLSTLVMLYFLYSIFDLVTRNLMFAYVKVKAQTSCVVTVQLICPFVFATYNNNPSFSYSEASSV